MFEIFDWAVVVIFLILLLTITIIVKNYNRSVADFLSANRCAGRYLLCVAGGMSSLGAVGLVGLMAVIYSTGFSTQWWPLMSVPIGLVLALSGWVTYRFRETRAMTMAQFFEMRYSRRFRIFSGILAWISGVVNFGIFPSIGANFFIYFCNLPETIPWLGVSSYSLVMFILLSVSVLFVFLGGQISVIITDFFQGIFMNISFLVIGAFALYNISWTTIVETMKQAPAQQSMLNPFHTANVPDFNFFYYAIAAVGAMYGCRAWQGSQGYNSSAKTAHEARMAGILGEWKGLITSLVILFLPISIYVIMNNPANVETANGIRTILAKITNPAMKNQMTVPIGLTYILPAGLKGMFCAVMLAALISTYDTYIHSWGSIFVQDIIVPIRKKHISPKTHMRLLKGSIVFVAVFAFLFSSYFRHTENVLLFFAITGAIYLGGAGAVITGGLYWKRGTANAAWLAFIVGSSISLGTIFLRQSWASYIYPWLETYSPDFLLFVKYILEDIASAIPGINWKVTPDTFPINSQWMFFFSIMGAISIYVGVSLFEWLVLKREPFELDKILHRGKYAIKGEHEQDVIKPVTGLRAILPSKEFTRGDKLIYYFNLSWALGWFLIFLVGTAYNLTHEVSDDSWASFWYVKTIIIVVIGFGTTVWFTIGGVFDIKYMLQKLKSLKRHDDDDGVVEYKS